MKKITIFSFLILLSTYMFSAVAASKNEAQNIANETLIILTGLNAELNNITKKEDITTQLKARVENSVKKLQSLEQKVINFKRSSTAQQNAELDSVFNTGAYAAALKKAIQTLFENVKRISNIEGGKELAKIISG